MPFQNQDFFRLTFFRILDASGNKGLTQLLDLRKEAELSFLADSSGIQEGFCLRSCRRALLLAKYLVDEKGDLSKDRLNALLVLLEKEGHIVYLSGLSDGVIVSQILFVLKKIKEDEKFYKSIKRFQGPLCHQWAEELIRASLGLEEGVRLTDAHIRIAVLSACLSVLRQNVGSCFATAPAILIQSQQLEKLIADLYELLMTGKLKRTFGGVEFSVPLSPSSGAGDLNKSLDLNRAYDLSPGLLLAFESIGFISETLPISEKISALKNLLLPFRDKIANLKVSDLIHLMLLSHFEIEEEELRSYEKIEKSLAKSQSLGGSLIGHLSPKKMQACQQMVQKEKRARAAFKSITDHALLKAWEFTLASFSEVKMEFSRWNLYSSLGFDHEEKGGIGEIIYAALHKQLETNNKKVAEYQAEYEVAYDQLRGTESLLKRASTESEIRRLQAEHSARLYHMQTCLEMRDKCHEDSSRYSLFFTFVLKEYDLKFQEYFQEIYDAEMQDVQLGPYEDSPAGFRLVYKHGRSNASLWTMIYNAEQYIDALTQFFLAVEYQVAGDSDWDEAPRLLSEITTAVVSHVRTDEFLASAVLRITKAHGGPIPKDPLKALETMEKKPWAYTSGGAMTTLLKTYYRRESEITEEAKWVENETNLLVFILDAIKTIPMNLEESIVLQDKALLMSSPSHAFILYPSWDLMREGWKDTIFTYSWVRDNIIIPRREYYAKINLSAEEQAFLMQELFKELPAQIASKLKGSETLENVSIQAFRDRILKLLQSHFAGILQSQHFEDKIDSFLYEMLPITSGIGWKNTIRKLLSEFEFTEIEKVLSEFPDHNSSFLSAKMVKDLAKIFYCQAKKSICLPFDLHEHIAKQASDLNLAQPRPVLFADTNWIGNYFGFVLNPGTSQLELWRLDITGSKGSPMSTWKHWIDGTDKKTWNIYSRPFEYE